MKNNCIFVVIITAAMCIGCDFYRCPHGLSSGCTKTCSDTRDSEINICRNLYGPDGVGDQMQFDTCVAKADEGYDTCYDNCPCAGDLTADIDRAYVSPCE